MMKHQANVKQRLTRPVVMIRTQQQGHDKGDKRRVGLPDSGMRLLSSDNPPSLSRFSKQMSGMSAPCMLGDKCSICAAVKHLGS